MNTPEELIKDMQDIKYGWIEKNGTRHEEQIVRALFNKGFYLQSPKELKEHRLGVCWDQVEYERYYMEKMNIPFKTIFVIYDTKVKQHMHSFLVYKEKKNYCWIENTYENFIGINKYSSMEELIKDVMKDFLIQNHLLIIGENIKYYVFDKPEYGLNCTEYVMHALKGTLLEKDFSNLGI